MGHRAGPSEDVAPDLGGDHSGPAGPTGKEGLGLHGACASCWAVERGRDEVAKEEEVAPERAGISLAQTVLHSLISVSRASPETHATWRFWADWRDPLYHASTKPNDHVGSYASPLAYLRTCIYFASKLNLKVILKNELLQTYWCMNMVYVIF